jgi:hypothetical protein
VTRPGSAMVHPSMLARVEAVTARSMTARCVVTRAAASEPSYDPATGVATYPTAVQVWDGPCRVQPEKVGNPTDRVGEQEITVRSYTVLLPRGAVVDLGDTVTATVAVDPELVGRPLHVVDVMPSSLQVERVARAIDADDIGSWRHA